MAKTFILQQLSDAPKIPLIQSFRLDDYFKMSNWFSGSSALLEGQIVPLHET